MRIEIRRLLLNTRVLGVFVFLMSLIPVMPNAVQAQNTEENRESEIQAMTFSQLQGKFYKTKIEKEISVDIYEMRLEQALRVIARKTGLRLSYRGDIMDDKRITLTDSGISVSEALSTVLEGTGLDYKFSQDGYLLITKIHENIDETIYQETITGSVIDARTQEALPGVNILIQGTERGTVTDVDGNFELEVESLDVTLIVTYIGYERQEVNVAGRTQLDLELIPGVVAGEELVVVGYGTAERGTLTGAISSVSAEDLNQVTAMGTSDRLVGQVQGITARKADARPGATAAIQIRNMGDPLFVIDGVPANHDDFNELGQNDIEDISILKDGSAAVYGMRAANGVIIVETKRGSYGEAATQVNITGEYGIRHFTRYPVAANAYQFQRGKVEADQNEGNPRRISSEELENWRQGAYKTYNYNDVVFDPASEYKLGVNVSGGAENIRYYISANNALENASLDDFLYTRTNLQANIDGRLNDNLTIGTQIRGRYEFNQQVGAPGGDDYANPLTSVLHMWPHEPMYANDNPNYLYQAHRLVANPAIIDRDLAGVLDDYTNEITGKLYASYDFDFGLSAQATYSYRFFYLFNHAHENSYDAYRYNEVDGYYSEPGWGNQDGFRDDETSFGTTRFSQIRLNYEHDFQDHSFDALLAFERQKEDFDFRSTQTEASTNFISVQYLSEMVNLSHDIFEETRAGFVGRVNYNYKEKYLVDVVGRYDGSYLFAPDKRWGLFPGVSVGWRLTEESFLNDNDILTDLKLRASYGVTGSETIDGGGIGVGYVFEINNRIGRNRTPIVDPYAYLEGYNFQVGGTVLDGNFVIGTQPRGLPITNLTWVENITTNIGVDFSLFIDRLNGTFDVFQRKRKGLPAPRYDVLVPVEVGYSLPPENLNSDAIQGVEGSLSYNGNISTDFNYSIGVNATFARQKDISTYKPRFENSWDEYRNSVENRWSFINWGYEVEGQFQSEEEIDNYPVNIDGEGNRTLLPGDLIYKDTNGDGIINEMDVRPIGYGQNRNPIMNYGLNSQINYKAFQVYIGFNGGMLQSWTQNGFLRHPFNANGNSPTFMLEDRWHREDPYNDQSDWISGQYPAIREGNNQHSNYRHSDFWLTNVRYFRLRNLAVTYTLPNELIEQFGINGISVTARGMNLFSIDNMREYQVDPEISNGDGLQYPNQRLISLSVNVRI